MRHQHRFLFALALPLVMLGGCAKETPADDPNAPVGEITFDIGFAGDGETRVATDALFNSTWENGDEIGIFATTHGQPLAATASGNYIHNVRLTYSGGSWTPDAPLYWPGGSAKLDFVAYYPWDGLFNDPTAIAFTVHLGQHGTTDGTPGGKSNFNASDLLTAKADNGGSGYGMAATSVPLTFTHALAMVQVTLDNSTGLLDTSGNIAVTLRGTRPTAALDLSTGTATVDDTASPADITMHRFTDPAAPTALVFRALVPPQTLAAGAQMFRATDGTHILVSPPLTEALTLVAGQAETFGQRIPLPSVETATLVFTDGGDPAEVTAIHTGDGNYDITPGGDGTRTVYSITLRGKTHLIGRKDNETFTLKIVPATGELRFRDAVDDGSGTPKIPIGTYAEFAMIGTATDKGSLAGKYLQEADLDLLGAAELETAGLVRQNWIPIGTGSGRFIGSYDGGGHTLANLYINRTIASVVGLFGAVGRGGKLSHVGIISGTVSGMSFVGGVCGVNEGSVDGSYNRGAVSGTEYHIGGVCGNNDASLTDCDNEGKVSGDDITGGVCGYNSGTITACKNSGSVTGTGDSIGGICGGNLHITEECENTGAVSGNLLVGGVCGDNSLGTITACHNTGEVSGIDRVGGVCGVNGDDRDVATITACYNTGTVSGNSAVGGVCGRNRFEATITACRNIGAVESEGYYIGGVVGLNEFLTISCYNTAVVTGVEYVGGVCGRNFVPEGQPQEEQRAELVGCYNTGEVWGGDSVGEVCGWNDAALGVIYCYFRDGNTAIGGGVQPNFQYSAFKFGSNTWPNPWDAGWGLYEGEELFVGDWGDLGGWNGGDPLFPRLWWEP